jgi:hypothetical protein
MATQAARGYNPLAVGTQRHTANPAAILANTDTGKGYKWVSNIVIWGLGLVSIAVLITAGIALGFGHSETLVSLNGMTFQTAPSTSTNPSDYPSRYTLVAEGISTTVNLKWTFILLSLPPFALSMIFAGIHWSRKDRISPPQTREDGTGEFKWQIGHNANHVNKHGVDIFSVFWGILVEAPLFAYLLLWSGERSFEIVFLVTLLVALIPSMPTFFNIASYMQRDNATRVDFAVWGSTKTLICLTTTTIAATIVFVWVLFFERYMQTGRTSNSGVGANNYGVHTVNWMVSVYITWWTLYNIYALGYAAYYVEKNGTDGFDREKLFKSAALYYFGVMNTVAYSVLVFTIAVVLALHQ